MAGQPRDKRKTHISVKDRVAYKRSLVAAGKISKLRYENYKLLYQELKDAKKY